MISKEERRKRLIDDMKKIAEHRGKDVSTAIEFAQSIPDKVLDHLEELGYGSEKIKIDEDTETLEAKSDKMNSKSAMIFTVKSVKD